MLHAYAIPAEDSPRVEAGAPWKSIVNVGAVLMLLCGSTSMALMAFEQMSLNNIEIKVRDTQAHVHAIRESIALLNKSVHSQARQLADIAQILSHASVRGRGLFMRPPELSDAAGLPGNRSADRGLSPRV